MMENDSLPSGVLLVDKPRGKTSFSLVNALRRLLHVKKIGHAGTLDPFATGLMVMLIGKKYTKMSNDFLCNDKEYVATLHLGIATDSYDCDGVVMSTSPVIPSLDEVNQAISQFQGEIMQTPPMFSAKKIGGKKLCDLARKGVTIERTAVPVRVETTVLAYEYPHLNIQVSCSKGTYIRSIAHDLGNILQCGAHLSALQRTRSGKFSLDNAIDGALLYAVNTDVDKIVKAINKI